MRNTGTVLAPLPGTADERRSVATVPAMGYPAQAMAAGCILARAARDMSRTTSLEAEQRIEILTLI